MAEGAALRLGSPQSGRNLKCLRKQKEAALIRARREKELFTVRLKKPAKAISHKA